MKDINSERVLGFDQIREKLRSYATSAKGKKEAAELELSSFEDAIELGENSGFNEDFDSKTHLKDLHKRYL